MSDKNISVQKDANGEILTVTLNYATYKSLLNPDFSDKKDESFSEKWGKALSSDDFRSSVKDRIENWEV